MMVGIIKNFEFTTREDGGFDCTTTLTSIGVNVIEKEGGNEAPNEIVDPTTSYNLDLQDNEAVQEFFQSNYLVFIFFTSFFYRYLNLFSIITTTNSHLIINLRNNFT